MRALDKIIVLSLLRLRIVKGALDSGSGDTRSNQDHCILFLGTTFYLNSEWLFTNDSGV